MRELSPESLVLETVRADTDPAIAGLGWLTLTRADRLNAMGATMLRELVDAARWFDQRLATRVVIVRGEGRAFSAGADLRDPPSAAPSSDAGGADDDAWAARREAGQRGLRMANAIEQMRAITIAQVHDYAVGGGLVLVSACDLRVCAEDAQLFIPEVELGIPLAWGGIPRLVREIGPALTKELVITCRRFAPSEAKAIGFFNRVVPPERLEAETLDLARQVSRMPAGPVVMTKDHVNAVTNAMAPSLTAFADGEALAAAMADPGGRAARESYVAKALRRSKE
ncbi:MAG TPA: enoyl-CoA hydratase/isomerase family protein [Thermoanaerobaculia bacterium]|nr:enoyl-CoA hydratase/isomerase family protein [Thermoanaerobaculia bacterium]